MSDQSQNSSQNVARFCRLRLCSLARLEKEKKRLFGKLEECQARKIKAVNIVEREKSYKDIA